MADWIVRYFGELNAEQERSVTRWAEMFDPKAGKPRWENPSDARFYLAIFAREILAALVTSEGVTPETRVYRGLAADPQEKLKL